MVYCREGAERLPPSRARDARLGMNVARILASRRLLSLQENRALRLIVLVLSACVFAFALRLAWLAFTSPLELEMREGSVWIHVLAKRAGVDLYDTARVAFVNMNHGPLDPILKTWISRCMPALPGHMVTRTFVLLTPIFLFASAYKISRGDLAASLLAAGTLFLFICHLSVLMLVGRSDPTAICGLAICGALAHQLIVTPQRNWSQRSYVVKQLGLGAASSAVFLTSSRYLPVAAALQFVVLCAQLAAPDGHGEPTTRPPTRRARLGGASRTLLISTGLYLVGFAAVWVAMLLFEFHGDLQSYYKHFFGFFSVKSGWGTFSGPAFELVPGELVQTRRGSALVGLALIWLGLYRLRRQPGELIAWLLMLAAIWVSVAYGYFKNRGEAGSITSSSLSPSPGSSWCTPSAGAIEGGLSLSSCCSRSSPWHCPGKLLSRSRRHFVTYAPEAEYFGARSRRSRRGNVCSVKRLTCSRRPTTTRS